MVSNTHKNLLLLCNVFHIKLVLNKFILSQNLTDSKEDYHKGMSGVLILHEDMFVGLLLLLCLDY